MSIELLPGSSSNINTEFVDGCPGLSPDGLELYFTSNRPGGLGGVDIWVAKRSSTSAGFGEPVNLGAPINSEHNEFCPTFTQGDRLFFSSTRDDPPPRGDIYMVKRGPHGWGPVQRLGPNVNSSSGIDEKVAMFEDEQGRTVIYFSSSRNGRNQIYYSVDFGPAFPVAGINSSNADARPGVSKDGLELFWDSTRFGSVGGGTDFWTATRSSTSATWGAAEHLGSLSAPGPGIFFGPGFDAGAFLSWDRSALIFGSARGGEGANDLYISTRQKITGR